MSTRPLVDRLTDAIERVAMEDSALFSDVHVSRLVVQLNGGGLDLRLAARDLASAIDREVEAGKLGRGRVTNRRLDQRLAKAAAND